MTTILPNKAAPVFAAGLLATLALTAADNAWGDCSITSTSTNAFPLQITVPPQVYVSKNTPVGTIIYTSPPVTGPNKTRFELSCGSGTLISVFNHAGSQTVGNNNTFPIGTSGVGFRWRQTNTITNLVEYIGPNDNLTNIGIGLVSFGHTTHRLLLVKTGNIDSPVTYNGSNIATLRYSPIAVMYMNTGAFTVLPGSCETRNVQIDLGRHYTSEISSLPIGGTIGATDAQIPVFNCPVGAKLAYGMNPLTSIVYGRPSVITLDPSDVSAQGVGIMVTDQNGQNAPFGTRKSIGTVPSSGNLDIPIRVSLMRLDTVKPGIISASIEFTLYYE